MLHFWKNRKHNQYEGIPNSIRVAGKRGNIDYNINDHLGVIFQLYGSIWPKVLPYCILNTLFIAISLFLRRNEHFVLDLSFNDTGHKFMSLMVSFLLITRCSIAYRRWTDARMLLINLTKSCRELSHCAVTFSAFHRTSSATRWRLQVCHYTYILLRVIVSVLQYDTKSEKIWEISDLSDQEKKALTHAIGGAVERAPFLLVLFLRNAIASHELYLEKPLDVNEELQLHSFSEDIISAYHGLLTLLNTPFPLPLLQMSRTFLALWVFSLPLALLSDIEGHIPILLITFFSTYGFFGLELVCIELDDPFGDNENDFDCLGLAKVVFDDMGIALQNTDGQKAFQQLQTFSISSSIQNSSNYLVNSTSVLLDLGSSIDFSDMELFENEEKVHLNEKGRMKSDLRRWSVDFKSRERLI